MMQRITADIDSKSIIALCWNLYKGFRYIENIEIVNISKSNSKGYHLIFWTSKKYSKKKIFDLRKIIGDDDRRILKDMKRKNPKQYLFYKKVYNKNKKRT